jgi:ubiquinol-cytochrome c reductase cytochrome b subunit
LPAPRPIAQDVGLFGVLLIVADGVILPGLMSPGLLSSMGVMATFHLALLVHVMATFYVGTFDTARTATWLLLIALWAGSEIVAFTSYILPFNQLPIVRDATAMAAVLWPAAALLVLVLDIAVMYVATPRRRPALSFAMLLAAAIAVVLIARMPLSAFDLVVLPDPGPYRDFDIVPAWYALPFYAMLRAVPVKVLGIAVTFAALLMPMIWPWTQADRLRLGDTRWAWRLAWLAFAATVIGLGWLGARPPDESTILAARILVVGYFAYFLVVPFALRRMVPETA